jgi:hypothetical protein
MWLLLHGASDWVRAVKPADCYAVGALGCFLPFVRSGSRRAALSVSFFRRKYACRRFRLARTRCCCPMLAYNFGLPQTQCELPCHGKTGGKRIPALHCRIVLSYKLPFFTSPFS